MNVLFTRLRFPASLFLVLGFVAIQLSLHILCEMFTSKLLLYAVFLCCSICFVLAVETSSVSNLDGEFWQFTRKRCDPGCNMP